MMAVCRKGRLHGGSRLHNKKSKRPPKDCHGTAVLKDKNKPRTCGL